MLMKSLSIRGLNFFYFFDISIAFDRKIVDFSFSKMYENVPFFSYEVKI